MSFASRALFEELGATPGFDFGLKKRGLLMLCKTARAFHEEERMAVKARALGIPAEALDAKAVAALEPGIRMDIAGAVLFPQDCHLAPHRFMADLQRAVTSAGGEIAFHSEVTGWRFDSRNIAAAVTGRGETDGDEFVLCGGAWSAVVARQLRLAVPMQAGKGYALTVPQPRQLPRHCAILAEARVAVTPIASALRFGGTMEIAGLNQKIDPRRVRGITQAVPAYFPEFSAADFAGLSPWSGLRPCSPDGLPYLGRTRAYENLSLATGHAMMGLSLGPITGQIMAGILSDEKPASDIALLDPDRYA